MQIVEDFDKNGKKIFKVDGKIFDTYAKAEAYVRTKEIEKLAKGNQVSNQAKEQI